MSRIKAVHLINDSYRKTFLDSIDWTLTVKSDCVNSKFANFKCMAQCKFTKYKKKSCTFNLLIINQANFVSAS